jgi:glycosyltransferase involved in cell wall biosynthesis
VTAVGGLAELVDEGITGYIVPPHEDNRLSEAIIRYFSEKREQTFSANIIKKREMNSFARIREVFSDMYRDMNTQ